MEGEIGCWVVALVLHIYIYIYMNYGAMTFKIKNGRPREKIE